MPPHVVAVFYGDEPRRQRSSHGIGWAVVRTSSTIDTGVKIEHALPGKIFEFLDPERFERIQFLVDYTPTTGLTDPLSKCHVL